MTTVVRVHHPVEIIMEFRRPPVEIEQEDPPGSGQNCSKSLRGDGTANEARRRRQCIVPVSLSAIISFFVGAQCAFILLASGIALPTSSSLDQPPPSSPADEPSTPSNTTAGSLRSPSPLDNETFFSSLFERSGGEFTIVPIRTRLEERRNKDSMCVVVRTYHGHGRRFGVFLRAWENVAASIKKDERDVQMILANTDSSPADEAFFRGALSPVLADYDASSSSAISYHMAVLPERSCPGERCLPRKGMYGYDVTQLILDELLSKNEGTSNIRCTTFLITNGDNYYHPNLLVQTRMNVPPEAGRPGMVGFDFISHHRWNRHVSVKFVMGKVDLGAVFVDAKAIRDCEGAVFRDRGDAELNFMADWLFFEALMDCGVETEAVHQTLFIHQ